MGVHDHSQKQGQVGRIRLLFCPPVSCWCLPVAEPHGSHRAKQPRWWILEVSLPGHREGWSRVEHGSQGKQKNYHIFCCPLLSCAFNKLLSLWTAHLSSHKRKTFPYTVFRITTLTHYTLCSLFHFLTHPSTNLDANLLYALATK